MEILFVVIFTLSSLLTFSFENQVLQEARNAHLPVDFDDQQVQYLAGLSNVSHLEAALEKLLIPRVVNTANHEKVFNYLVSELDNLGWDIEIDEFESEVPRFGTLTFKNVIGTLNPSAHQFLVLACHYDSKYFAEFDFIGATDSAVPCAMMLNLAQVMSRDLNKIDKNSDLGLKLVFFDGEEAFVQWGPNDSIYGAKHLASKWDQNLRVGPGTELTSDIKRINVLVLLDLIGEANPSFYCLFQDTVKWYIRLADAEDRLGQLGLLMNHKKNYFKRMLSQSYIEDDHIPFLQRGVPILHMIPTPFPQVWHTEGDNSDIIDITTVENMNKIIRIFVAEYLHLSILEDDTEDNNPRSEL